MHLRNLVPLVPADLVQTLEDHDIKTDAELLFSGATIEVFAKLPPGTINIAALARYTDLVAERTSALRVRGDEELDRILAKRNAGDLEITSGIDGLDVLFGNGRVFEISGKRTSGKSALILQTVLQRLSTHLSANVLWLDTCGNFSVERAVQVAKELGIKTPSSVLERLHVSPVLNIQAAQNFLEELRLSLASCSGGHKSQCVVIDSITPLFAPLLGPISAQGHAVMTGFMQHLRDIARTDWLTIFVINDTANCTLPRLKSSHAPTARKPALGPSFTYLTDCTLWLTRYEVGGDGDGRVSVHVEVLRSRMMVRMSLQESILS